MTMDPEKVSLLTEFAEKILLTPTSPMLMPHLLQYVRKPMQKDCILQIQKPPFL